jgi:transporter family-2 protein
MLRYTGYAAWAAAAGLFIPVMAVLNARLGRAMGEATHAPVALFLIGLLVASVVSMIATGRLPSLAVPAGCRPVDFAGGAIVAGYVISMTLLAPRFGVGNAILFVMIAQIVASAAIDHLGLFGAAVRPVSTLRASGLCVVIIGLTLSQLAATNSAKE